MRHWGLLLAALSGSFLVSACSAEVGDGENVGSASQSIVRPKRAGGPDQVVMLYATLFDSQTGELSHRTCSGVYYAPRVVATAAHCLDTDPEHLQSVLQVLVYHGDDFEADLSELAPTGAGYDVPRPGQPSAFAAADSFEVHPNWDRDLIYPDLGVVYLDRALPFDPMPLARFRLTSPQWDKKEAIISGWGGDEATSPTTASGGRIQRTGKTRLLGSPSAADYHAEDPNPGMLVPGVRKDVIKIDGRAPFSNACFGDSGSPLLIKERGQQYVAGIEYFGGLSCEDYSLYTRVEPFLPFFEQAVRRAGNSPLTPQLECVAANQDGSLTAFFGYENRNGVGLDVPYGRDNSLPLDANGYRPTHFAPGQHDFVFGVDFAPGHKLVYELKAGSSKTNLIVNERSRRCGDEVAQQALCGQSCRGQLRSGCTGLADYATCIEGCTGFYEIFADAAQCASNIDDLNHCLASTPPGPENWMCFEESAPGAGDGVADAAACTPFIDAFFECAFGG